jgi:hypothetical protein
VKERDVKERGKEREMGRKRKKERKRQEKWEIERKGVRDGGEKERGGTQREREGEREREREWQRERRRERGREGERGKARELEHSAAQCLYMDLWIIRTRDWGEITRSVWRYRVQAKCFSSILRGWPISVTHKISYKLPKPA